MQRLAQQLIRSEEGTTMLEQGLVIALVSTGAVAFAGQVTSFFTSWFGSLMQHASAAWPQ